MIFYKTYAQVPAPVKFGPMTKLEICAFVTVVGFGELFAA
jgi:hypothetical protein